jgi:hypothetical protein
MKSPTEVPVNSEKTLHTKIEGLSGIQIIFIHRSLPGFIVKKFYSSAFSAFGGGSGLPRPITKPLVPSGILGPEIGLFTETEPEIVGDETFPDMGIENIRNVNTSQTVVIAM